MSENAFGISLYINIQKNQIHIKNNFRKESIKNTLDRESFFILFFQGHFAMLK